MDNVSPAELAQYDQNIMHLNDELDLMIFLGRLLRSQYSDPMDRLVKLNSIVTDLSDSFVHVMLQLAIMRLAEYQDRLTEPMDISAEKTE